MASSADRRLLRDLNAVSALVDEGRPSADERLAATFGYDRLRLVRRRLRFDRYTARVARLKQWQWSVLIASLGCGAAVSMMGVIQLVWQFRSVLSGLGAVAFVLTVFLKTRRGRIDEGWIGS